MNKENTQTIDDIYENDVIRDTRFGRKMKDFNETRIQSSESTESDSVRMRISRAAPVCLVLLCFLLLTAVIVLSVHIYTNNTNYTHEKNQLLTNITNITEERDELLTRNTNLTEKKDTLTKMNVNLMNLRNQLNNTLQIVDGWIYYQSSFYFVSNDTGKSWTESRRDCQQRGADLVIINNREEQDFVMNITYGKECWIGLTDTEEEKRWKWIDGTNATTTFWGSNSMHREPNGSRDENCVMTYFKKVPDILWWLDITCDYAIQWICEKSVSPLIQP